MNPRELVDHIRSGPAELVLDKPLPRFPRRTRSHPYPFCCRTPSPCDYNDFIQALQSSETIRSVTCHSHRRLRIAEDEWELLVNTIGSIEGIQTLLALSCTGGSPDFHPFQVVADAVSSAQSLHKLEVGIGGETFPRDPSGLIALANALGEHTALQGFIWDDFCSPQEETPQDVSPDPVLQALLACPYLRCARIMTKCAGADAIRSLLQLPMAIGLQLTLLPHHWLVVADEIRQDRYHVQSLKMCLLRGAPSEDTKAVKAVASAIRSNPPLVCLCLQLDHGFTDEVGVALAKALMSNTNLRTITLSVDAVLDEPIATTRNIETLGVPAYEAFSAMLRVNTSITLELPRFDSAGGDESLRDSRDQMRIEQGLNRVGRGKLLSSSQTTRKEWVDALHKLDSYNFNVDESPTFRIGCLHSLLQLDPGMCFNDASNSGE
jgi:hypothetical protein